MTGDKLQPLWSRFWREAFPLLDPDTVSLDELRRLEIAARSWHVSVKRALDTRQTRTRRDAA